MSTKSERIKPVGETTPAEQQSSKPITFRLDPESHKALCQRANQLGVSPHQLARSFIFEALTSQVALEELFKAIVAIRKDQLHLRKALGHSVETLMVSAGKISVPDARDWAKQTFGLE